MSDEPAGDPELWVDLHGDALYRYALLRLRDPEAAAEVVQETFLDALRARSGFSGRSSERTWLIGILRHKIIDHFRKARRESTIPADGAGDDVAGDFFDRRGVWKAGAVRRDADARRAFERRELLATLDGCVSALPPHFRDVFVLREFEGLSGEEVCQILHITPTNLWARLHRARLLLRRCLERHGFDFLETGPS